MVLESVLFGLLAALGWGVADFAAAAVSRKIGVYSTVLGVHAVSIPAASMYFLVAEGPWQLSPGHWVALAGLAALALVAYLSFYKALQIGPLAIVSPLVSANAVVVIALAAVLVGERLSTPQAIGASASIGGVALACVNLQGVRSPRDLIGKGALFGLLALLGIGVWQLSIGILSRDIGWFLPIYVCRLLTLAMLAPAVAFQGGLPWRRLTLPLALGVAITGILETAGLFAFARGSEVGIISIVAAASAAYPVIPIIFGLLVFKERLGAVQAIGLVIALAGLLALALST